MSVKNLVSFLKRWRRRRKFFHSSSRSSEFFGHFETFDHANRFGSRYSKQLGYGLLHGEQLLRLSGQGKSISQAFSRLKETAYPGIQVARLTTTSSLNSAQSLDRLTDLELEGISWIELKGLEQNTTLSHLQFAKVGLNDVLLTQGVLPYLDRDLSSELLTNDAQPAHLLLECLPLSDGPPYVTLHKAGGGVTPFRVDNMQALTASLAELGYHLVSHWRDVDSYIDCPSERGGRVEFGHGMHFQHGGFGKS